MVLTLQGFGNSWGLIMVNSNYCRMPSLTRICDLLLCHELSLRPSPLRLWPHQLLPSKTKSFHKTKSSTAHLFSLLITLQPPWKKILTTMTVGMQRTDTPLTTQPSPFAHPGKITSP